MQKERQQEFKQLKEILGAAAAQLMLEVPDAETCYFLGTLPGLPASPGSNDGTRQSQ